MVQCPMISVAFDKYDKILILTANSATLKPQKATLLSQCGFDVDDDRFVIYGCQDVPGFDAVAKGEAVDVEYVTPGVVKLVKDILTKVPTIKSICLECTELPPYSDALRFHTKLPVFDAITCCDFFMRSRQDNPRVGLSNWQMDWDGVQENYMFGDNLSPEDKAKVVKQEALRSIETTKTASKGGSFGKLTAPPSYPKAGVPTLGVLRMDIEYEASEGEVSYPKSFSYPVYYRVVKGLSWDVLISGKLDKDVECELQEAIQFLDEKNVAGITCDYGLSMLFQAVARKATKKPVFLSPLSMLPAIDAAFHSNEQVLIVTGWWGEVLALAPLIQEECNLDPCSERFIPLTCDKIDHFTDFCTNEQRPHKLDVRNGLLTMIREKLKEKPGIRAILLEYTLLSIFSDAIKFEFELPVFDALTMCDLFMNGRLDNPLFGLHGWQTTWDGEHKKYKLGQNFEKGNGQYKDAYGREARAVM